MSEKTVVVGIDGSDGAVNAALWAGAVALKFESSLHIVHAMPIIGHNLTDAAAAIRAAAMSYQRDCALIFLREAADAVRSHYPNLVVTTESTDMQADEALIGLAGGSRMIVLGNSEVSPAGALLLGSTTLAVAAHADCPVVAWRGTHTAPTDQPVIVGVDRTQRAAVALNAAFEFADRFKAKLAAVRSWSIPGPVAAVSNPLMVDWDARQAAEWTQLTDIVDRCNQNHPDVDATCFVEPAKPTAALLHQIDVAGAQLVVVCSRGRNALASAVLGSTALGLLHHSTVPVMVCSEAGGAHPPTAAV
ncbi:universal stress protein [Mycolicibacterium stellerae]|uniref:universal stress protein n=1 Tax=Mycolicibacterium stellerae TaxID=2358193 RepID=UPI000F0B381B|nr:universal stress protein [Mycolicibacterium stellerae]